MVFGVSWSYSIVGTPGTFTVPPFVSSIKVTAIGATGGEGGDSVIDAGKGGLIVTTLPVSQGQIFYAYIGGVGVAATGSGSGAGGSNGGGDGKHGAGGGGGTDLRTVKSGTAWSSRVVVAGGGGGSNYGCSAFGGDGGGFTGAFGESGCQNGNGASGGRPTGAGPNGIHGTFGNGGDGDSTIVGGSGGGGGYYGGNGSNNGGGGGGGSSYTNGTLITNTQGYNADGSGSILIEYTILPTELPSVKPTALPTRPTTKPTADPSFAPSKLPTATPSAKPTFVPTARPSMKPSVAPSVKPSQAPSERPSAKPSVTPSEKPTQLPTTVPSVKPTADPTFIPTKLPSATPSVKPSQAPSERPTGKPSIEPTERPTKLPSEVPSIKPTALPTFRPSVKPSEKPTTVPTKKPTPGPTKFTIKASAWQSASNTPEASDFPETELLSDRPNTAIAFTGGGSRAYVAAFGVLSALTELDLMKQVRYIGGISGGAWATVMYSYAQGVNDDTYLPPIVYPAHIVYDDLSKMTKDCALTYAAADVVGDAILARWNPLNREALSFAESWAFALSKNYLEKVGIKKGVRFSWNRATVDSIHERNPTMNNPKYPFILPTNKDRPFPVIGMTLVGPQVASPFLVENQNLTLIEITPLYIGQFKTHDLRYNYVDDNNVQRHKTMRVGGAIEPFAFSHLGDAPDN
eukprot:gene28160-34976_t